MQYNIVNEYNNEKILKYKNQIKNQKNMILKESVVCIINYNNHNGMVLGNPNKLSLEYENRKKNCLYLNENLEKFENSLKKQSTKEKYESKYQKKQILIGPRSKI